MICKYGMINLPPLRRLLTPVLVFVALILAFRCMPESTSLPSFVFHAPPTPSPATAIPKSIFDEQLGFRNATRNHLSPAKKYFYSYEQKKPPANKSTSGLWQPVLDPYLAPLFRCSKAVNKYTGHIRIPQIIRNISAIAPELKKSEQRVFWNPTIIALPYWAENQYLLVSRIVTDGNHQENVLCEAYICYSESADTAGTGDRRCSRDDLDHVGPAGGMRCASPPVTLSVPPTPAEKCEGKFETYVDIPGFHDPRIFWSGKGEPLMMVNTQSRYACFGLWLIDLRTLHPPLQTLLSSSPDFPSLGPLKSYPTLTELTRNPPSTRATIEKNWFLFFPTSGESFVHYDLSASQGGQRGRTFSKLLGNGLSTTNLTDPLEHTCLYVNDHGQETNEAQTQGTWHQATNALRLILCNRSDPRCKGTAENTVFFALVHRKFANWLKLPMRYERFFIVWAASPPFGMIAINRDPVLLANETASGWTASENWDDEFANAVKVANTKSQGWNTSEPYGGKDFWAYFTYTVSMSYAWGRSPKGRLSGGDGPTDMHVGFLDDEVILGIGIDDKGQAFARVTAGDLLHCMRPCPGKSVKRRGSGEAGEAYAIAIESLT